MDISTPMRLIAFSIPMIIGGAFASLIGGCIVPVIGAIMAVAGVGLLVFQMMNSANDDEVVEMIREDRDVLKQAAKQRVIRMLPERVMIGDVSAMPGWEEPILFSGPCIERDEKLSTQLRVMKNGSLRVARSNVMVVVLGTYQLVLYSIAINHRTGQIYHDSLLECFYQDVAMSEGCTSSVKIAEGLESYLGRNPRLCRFIQAILAPGEVGWLGKLLLRSNPLWLPAWLFNFFVAEHRSELVIEEFKVAVTSGHGSGVMIGFDFIDDDVEDQGALERIDTEEEEVIRRRVREVKSLLRASQ